jgi:F-type H+-transporting ATPase subunit alpha
VGGSAQKKSMKKVAGTLKIDQAQYNELEAFSKFSSDIDKITAHTLDKGRKNSRLLIQPQYSPMPLGEQVAVLYCGTHSLLNSISLDRVKEFESDFLDIMRSAHADVLASLESGVLSDEACDTLEEVALAVCKNLQ